MNPWTLNFERWEIDSEKLGSELKGLFERVFFFRRFDVLRNVRKRWQRIVFRCVSWSAVRSWSAHIVGSISPVVRVSIQDRMAAPFEEITTVIRVRNVADMAADG